MKILLAVCLLVVGYLLGSIETHPSQAQSSYFYGSDGTMGSIHQPYGSNGPTYYYDNQGNSGSMYQGPGSNVPNLKSPC